MLDPKVLAYLNIAKAVSEHVSAARRVAEGIATHAEKERARRQAEYHKLEAERKLRQEKVIGT